MANRLITARGCCSKTAGVLIQQLLWHLTRFSDLNVSNLLIKSTLTITHTFYVSNHNRLYIWTVWCSVFLDLRSSIGCVRQSSLPKGFVRTMFQPPSHVFLEWCIWKESCKNRMTTLNSRIVCRCIANEPKSTTTSTLSNDANKNIFANKRTCKYEIVQLVTTSHT